MCTPLYYRRVWGRMRMFMRMYDWATVLFTWNHHNTVNRLYSNTNKKSKPKESPESYPALFLSHENTRSQHPATTKRMLTRAWPLCTMTSCFGFRKSVSHPSCLTVRDPIDCSPPDSSVHGIFQARILECLAISFSRGSSRPRDWTPVSRIAGRFFFFQCLTTPYCLLCCF